jgi:hypothetical protein
MALFSITEKYLKLTSNLYKYCFLLSKCSFKIDLLALLPNHKVAPELLLESNSES